VMIANLAGPLRTIRSTGASPTLRRTKGHGTDGTDWLPVRGTSTLRDCPVPSRSIRAGTSATALRKRSPPDVGLGDHDRVVADLCALRACADPVAAEACTRGAEDPVNLPTRRRVTTTVSTGRKATTRRTYSGCRKCSRDK